MIAPTVSEIHPAGLAEAFAARLENLRGERFTERLLAADPSLWREPEAIGERLGWLDLPTSMMAELPRFSRLADELVADGVRDVVLLGMGGSSLAPEVFSAVLGGSEGLRLTVVDTTHPATVAASLDAFTDASSVFIAASKSGATVETMALLDTFWEASNGSGERFIAITDPGSALAERASVQGFRHLQLSPVTVGGRYSALAPFGLLPAVLMGASGDGLLQGARDVMARADEAIQLGVFMAEAVLAGRDKLTLLADAETAPLLPWLEQLVAESLGKLGTGLVPAYGEPEGAHYGPDRVFARLARVSDVESAEVDRDLLAEGHPVARLLWAGPTAVGGEMMRWELATATAGAVLGLNPFDQPDVDLAKQLARDAIGAAAADGDPPIVDVGDDEGFADALAHWLGKAAPGDYIALQAFLPPTPEVIGMLESLRANLAATGLPTTLGFGPRFLHSTGQLHKGGRDGVFCLQVFDEGSEDAAVAGSDYSFRELINAQALGDARALDRRGRSVLRLRMSSGA